MGTIKISKQDWIRIGKTAGWFQKQAYHSDLIQSALEEWRKDKDDTQFLFSVKRLLAGGEKIDPGVVLQIDKIMTLWEKNPLMVNAYAAKAAAHLGYGEKSPYAPVSSEKVHKEQTDILNEEPFQVRTRYAPVSEKSQLSSVPA